MVASASAQPPAGHHTVTGFGGVHLFDLTQKFEEQGTDLGTAVDFGGRYQYNVNERWAIEWNVLFSPGEAKVTSSGRSVDVTASYYTLGLVLNLATSSPLVPFVVGGMGAGTYDVSDGGTSDSSFAVSFGGGVLYSLNSRLAIRFDVRDFVTNSGHLAPPSLETLELPSEFSETLHDLAVTVGFSIYF